MQLYHGWAGILSSAGPLLFLAMTASACGSEAIDEKLASVQEPASSLSPKEKLGKALFFDENLSTPKGQACAACHAPEVGWTGPKQGINKHGAVYPGAVHNRFGNRKPPA